MTGFGQAKLVASLAGGVLIFVGLLALLASWNSRGQEIARLKEWQGQVVTATTDAYSFADKPGTLRKPFAPADVPHSITMLGNNLKVMLLANAALTHDAEQAELRAKNADKALATATVIFDQRFSSAEKRIAALDARKPAPDPVKQCVNMTADSKAAWEGWK